MELCGIEVPMATAMEGGSQLAWRLLASLEGGSLLIAASALLAYTTHRKLARARRRGRPVRDVLITNTTNPLGNALQRKLESLGCSVRLAAVEGTSGAISGADSGVDKVDALIVVGAQPRAGGLDGMAGVVSDDVYDNIKLLDRLSPFVRRDGYVAWACAGSTSGAFSVAAAAFDAALEASLCHVAKMCLCEPVWVGRYERTEEAAERIIAALMPYTTQPDYMFSIRYAANKITGYIGRWLKIAS